MVISFAVVQFAPGGPVERVIAQLPGHRRLGDRRGSPAAAAISPGVSAEPGAGGDDDHLEISRRAGARPGIHQAARKAVRLRQAAARALRPDAVELCPLRFRRELFPRHQRPRPDQREDAGVDLARPVDDAALLSASRSRSASARRCKDGSRFDVWTSAVIIVGYAIPGFLFAILLIVLFAGGIVLRLVPAARPDLGQLGAACRGTDKIVDYFWHLALPLTAMALSAFATTTLLTKNSFLDEIRKQYVMTARAKGLTERQVLYGHVFRNAMLIVIAGFPGAFIGAFFAGVAADRDDLLARRARPARLRVGAQPRLSGRLRHALHLLADRASS